MYVEYRMFLTNVSVLSYEYLHIIKSRPRPGVPGEPPMVFSPDFPGPNVFLNIFKYY